MVKYKTTQRLTKEVINEILKIQKDKGLTPEEIVKVAKKKDNPLHDLFEWDNKVASDQWRLQQARVIVNEVKVIVDKKEYFAFESVNIQSDNSQNYNREYVPIVEILSNKDLKLQLIKSALQHLEYWEKQNSKYDELAPIIKVAQSVRTKLNKQWEKKKK